MPERYLLFVCTGNYYRSRFAEAVLVHDPQCQVVLCFGDIRMDLGEVLAPGIQHHTEQRLRLVIAPLLQEVQCENIAAHGVMQKLFFSSARLSGEKLNQRP